MTLLEWITRERWDQKDVAEMIGFRQQKLSKIVHQKQRPTIKDIIIIWNLTDGEVTINDWPALTGDLKVKTIQNRKTKR